MRRKLGFSLALILIYSGGLFLLYKTRPQTIKQSSTNLFEWVSQGNRKTKEAEAQQDNAIATLVIPKIHLEKPLYDIENPLNNVEQNVTILKGSTYPNEENSHLYLAAHSGSSRISFFEDLDELLIGDTFQVVFQKKVYTYQVDKIEVQEKTGTIKVPVGEQKQAILTTCHPTQEKKQLVLIANFQKETGSLS